MELNISEIDLNLDNNDNLKLKYNNIDTNANIKNHVVKKNVSFSAYNNYWDPKPEYEKAEPKKNNISYDEILNSMNMVVINGKLHFIPANKFQNTQQNTFHQNQSTRVNYQNNNQLSNQINQRNQNNHNNQGNSQNSYIFDKYFKNYQQEQTQNDVPKVPLTPEEIKKNIILHRLKQIEERKRIEQIKPKKLLFNTSNINISHQGNNPPNLNKLFRFSNR